MFDITLYGLPSWVVSLFMCDMTLMAVLPMCDISVGCSYM